ncbi:MAG: SOS response-associated peptidase family protein [bacterium]
MCEQRGGSVAGGAGGVLRRGAHHAPLRGFERQPELWPGHELLVVRADAEGGRAAERARWGLVPPWWASLEGAGGRQEGVSDVPGAGGVEAPTQPTWRDAWHRRGAAGRCLVLVTHWHEWTGPRGERTRVKLWVPGHRVVAVAGLWSLYRETLTAAMITCPAAEDLQGVHDRMPAILHPSGVGGVARGARRPAAADAAPGRDRGGHRGGLRGPLAGSRAPAGRQSSRQPSEISCLLRNILPTVEAGATVPPGVGGCPT